MFVASTGSQKKKTIKVNFLCHPGCTDCTEWPHDGSDECEDCIEGYFYDAPTKNCHKIKNYVIETSVIDKKNRIVEISLEKSPIEILNLENLDIGIRDDNDYDTFWKNGSDFTFSIK
jgi:hypothetical protein